MFLFLFFSFAPFSIPHLSELQRKFKDVDVTIVGATNEQDEGVSILIILIVEMVKETCLKRTERSSLERAFVCHRCRKFVTLSRKRTWTTQLSSTKPRLSMPVRNIDDAQSGLYVLLERTIYWSMDKHDPSLTLNHTFIFQSKW